MRKLVHKYARALVILFIFLCTSVLVYQRTSALASHCPATDYDCQIAEIQREIDALSGAHETNKQELSNLNKQLADLKNRITAILRNLDEIKIEIGNREVDLAYAETILYEKARNHYLFLRVYDPLLPFLSAGDAGEAFREIAFRARAADSDRKTMEKYGEDLINLKKDKQVLEKNQTNLAAVQKKVDERATFLEGEVEKTETYLATLSNKQQELQAAKSGGFQTSVGDTPPTFEPCSGPPGSINFCDPGFRPAFAAFSFGAPHRTGMSQYGAYGRAKLGQSVETILATYFQGAELVKSYPVPPTINVSGYGNIAFEDNYLLGIYEVPESWGDSGGFEALKAQAVAARSYALAVTNNGAGTICATESCQVYKPQLKSGKWREAVAATRGWVMTRGGTSASTYYSSTTGGFTISQWGWSGIKDTADSWPDTAYEKSAGSPWFYKGWYKSRGGASCGRSNPWLTNEEMADILNAWHVLYNGGGDVSRVSPLDTCWGGNPYSKGELVAVGGYTGVSSSSVVYSNDGSTLSVNLSTNKGSVSISGAEFKKAFNLRAPGYIGLKSSLFNIEKI
ncbi:hypothetical protein A3D84_00560 [Candidatus Woesebacteria bacterium RIFCSPHIGHO2_02_FULL_42_20]|uniref:Sporulation stage II protein D amidase enhancer LytB N-terminal domain-containing protein n=1 Tax=Candidatus Woesebacteria bacterium RIFCSPHIGHO2_12_FULL_41_24 TaxID=1802510 RepID=A0A1F8AVA9_9BACT|nr:MAG: hypothetical protein A2W15_02065 [Candidatus Woesebacteria bacterium RBG_16_41_13]OGM29743.1 MAG: hypothetical protein A2873_02485 [Candidatus Woesebacteria bacterium RIFCSPHIGHO2_01_FULL_42_80]OGM35270.1 MAG: hypothetical protein A3D84_00560 [Candidatus Woesebacteria bacterium RIFCSPHIGHO2_02_FULL_42_20]OGM55165.1 MAG: hypothetical protein A3E44_04570 [Candidatus Woesebacteria bacterium RIFCSPHIGHO2_12_FULL_41_24]OGM67737.1 MAG: hypothetical protein A2969_02275 [Candidatus Woesebacteri